MNHVKYIVVFYFFYTYTIHKKCCKQISYIQCNLTRANKINVTLQLLFSKICVIHHKIIIIINNIAEKFKLQSLSICHLN